MRIRRCFLLENTQKSTGSGCYKCTGWYAYSRPCTLAVTHLIPEYEATPYEPVAEQLDLFTDYLALEQQRKAEQEERDRELKIQKTLIGIRDRFGKNAIVKGLNMHKGATAMERNKQIGGHKA